MRWKMPPSGGTHGQPHAGIGEGPRTGHSVLTKNSQSFDSLHGGSVMRWKNLTFFAASFRHAANNVDIASADTITQNTAAINHGCERSSPPDRMASHMVQELSFSGLHGSAGCSCLQHAVTSSRGALSSISAAQRI